MMLFIVLLDIFVYFTLGTFRELGGTIPFMVFFWEAIPDCVLRDHTWKYLGEPYDILGIELGSVLCKASAIPSSLFL